MQHASNLHRKTMKSYSSGRIAAEEYPDSHAYHSHAAAAAMAADRVPDSNDDLVEVTLDVGNDGIRVRNIASATNDAESKLLAEEWERKASLRLSLRRNASARIKAFSEELKAYSQELKMELKRFSLNNTTAVSRVLDESHAGGSVPAGATARRRPSKLERNSSAAQEALKRLRFVTEAAGCGDREKLWKVVENRFFELASPEGLLSRNDFPECIGMKDSKDFALELFDAFARRRRQKVHSISKQELYEYFLELTDESFDTRLQLFFEMFDRNADGRISGEEVKEVIKLSASANRLAKLKEQAEEYAALIMEELDPDNLGYIELWQLESLLLQGTNGYINFSQNLNYSQALSQQLLPQRKNFLNRITRKAKSFIDDNRKRIWIVMLWVATMIGLFTWKFIQYKHRAAFQVMGYCVCFAKGAAETLKLNMALILLPVCRITITWLRNTKLGLIIPFDDNLNFHKTIAVGIIGGVIIHGGVHLTCDFPRIINSSEKKFFLIADDFHFKRPTYGYFLRSSEGVTAIIMVVLMIIAFTLATRWFRRNLLKLPKPFNKMTGFNAFWYSHHLFIIVYIALIIHGTTLFLAHKWYQKTTWMYLLVPILVYAGERTVRAFRSGHHGVDILKVAIYPGNVLSLYVTKPPGFKYKSGQYLFLKCPDVSPFEWHPFSITSAPGDNYLSVHIRTLGDWTQELKRIFSEVCEPPIGDKSGLLRADHDAEVRCKFPRLLIDGPYGAPAQDYKKYEIVLLIGLGIGATPFISILKDILSNMKSAQQQENFSPAATPKRRRDQPFTTENAYFYWVTREQGSFDWFKGVMNEIAEYDEKGVIGLHNYLTSVYEAGDYRSALITMLQALNHAKNGVDILSGTRVRTHLGRPNWKKVFSKVAALHKGARIGVFYCGAPFLAKELKALANEYTERYMVKYGTRFDFHKENF